MKTKLVVGLVIADEMEYMPMRDYADKHGGKRRDLFSREGHALTLTQGEKAIEVLSVLCGIGMVNAAAATAFLVSGGVDAVINTGLSGGMSGIRRGEITVGTDFIEHDFDLRPLGRELAEKPGQSYIYHADRTLLEHYRNLFDFIKPGVMVSGDCFVGSDSLRSQLVSRFDAMSCDMESAAAAYVCDLAGVPFAAVRRVSDDAGKSAGDSYQEMNEKAESALLDLVFEGIYAMFGNPAFWRE